MANANLEPTRSWSGHEVRDTRQDEGASTFGEDAVTHGLLLLGASTRTLSGGAGHGVTDVCPALGVSRPPAFPNHARRIQAQCSM